MPAHDPRHARERSQDICDDYQVQATCPATIRELPQPPGHLVTVAGRVHTHGGQLVEQMTTIGKAYVNASGHGCCHHAAHEDATGAW